MRIYTDESCTQPDQGPYLLIGGIVTDKETSKEVRKAIQVLKNKHNLQNDFEFHFSDIRDNNIEVYQELCSIFCNFYEQKCSYKRGLQTPRIYRRVCFDVILIPHSKIDHLKFSQGDSEIGFFQFYYTFLASVLKKHYCSDRKFHITIDAIRTKNPRMVPKLHKRLQTCLPDVQEPVKTIQPQDSKAELLLQMADVILGSVSFSWNKSKTETSSRIDAKRKVVQHLEENLGQPLNQTTYFAKSFNIWELTLQ
ncbi:hypothetical protein NUACC21_58190 [Scytonema sp. NUACC21]